PHISQVLWQELGQDGLIIDAAWPSVDPAALVKDTLLYVVQVNGKVRAKLEVPASMAKDEVEVLARSDAHVMKFLEGVTIRKVIVIPNKLINIVAN
ncbi:class I tRNA ligase family protein, partial [Reinekea sp.]|uniref:class I tRNA ligase family protein n=1 Tax=Reinekea sp. TaxID=1970455 RepID=UPI002A8249B3